MQKSYCDSKENKNQLHRNYESFSQSLEPRTPLGVMDQNIEVEESFTDDSNLQRIITLSKEIDKISKNYLQKQMQNQFKFRTERKKLIRTLKEKDQKINSLEKMGEQYLVVIRELTFLIDQSQANFNLSLPFYSTPTAKLAAIFKQFQLNFKAIGSLQQANLLNLNQLNQLRQLTSQQFGRYQDLLQKYQQTAQDKKNVEEKHKKQLENWEQMVSTSNQGQEKLKIRMEQLSTVIASTRRQLQQQRRKNSQLNCNQIMVTRLSNQNNELQNKFLQEKRQLSWRMQQLKKQLMNQSNKNQFLENQFSVLKRNLDQTAFSSRQQLESFKDQLKSTQQRKSRLEEEHAQSQIKIQKGNKQKELIIDQFNKKIKRFQQLNGNLHSQLEQRNRRCSSVEHQLSSVMARLQQRSKRCSSIQHQLNSVMARLEQRSKRCSSLQHQLNSVMARLEQRSKRCSSMEYELSSVISESRSLNSRINELQVQVQNKQNQLNKLKTSIKQANMIRQRLETTNIQNKIYNDLNRTLSSEYEDFKQNAKKEMHRLVLQHQSLVAKLNEDYAAKQAELSRLNCELEESVKSKQVAIESVSRKSKQLQEGVDNLQRQRKEQSQRIEMLQRERKDSQQLIERQKNTFRNQQRRTQQVIQQLQANLSTEISTFHQQIRFREAQTDLLNQNNQLLKDEIKTLNLKISAQLLPHIQQLSQINAKLRGKVTQLQEKETEQSKKAMSLKRELETSASELQKINQTLSKKNQYLKESMQVIIGKNQQLAKEVQVYQTRLKAFQLEYQYVKDCGVKSSLSFEQSQNLLAAAQEANRQLQQQVLKLRNREKELQKSKQELQEKMKSAEWNCQRSMKELSQLQAKLCQTSVKLQQRQNSLEVREKELVLVQASYSEACQQLKIAKLQLQGKDTALNSSLRNLEKQVFEAQTSMKMQLQRFKSQQSQSKSLIESLKGRIMSLQSQQEQLQQIISRQKVRIEQLREREKTLLRDSEEVMQRLTIQINKRDLQIRTLNTDISQTKITLLKGNNKSVDSYTQLHQQLILVSSELQDSQLRSNDLKSEVMQLRTKSLRLQSERANMSEGLKMKQMQIQNLKGTIEMLYHQKNQFAGKSQIYKRDGQQLSSILDTHISKRNNIITELAKEKMHQSMRVSMLQSRVTSGRSNKFK